MDILFGALAIVFALDVLALTWPGALGSRAELACTVFLAAAWVIGDGGYGSRSGVLAACAVAGAATVLRAAYRLVRAWADRTEVANLLRIHQGRG